MWQCVTVSATSEGGQQFFGSLMLLQLGGEAAVDPVSAGGHLVVP